jgi:hypothetical protein
LTPILQQALGQERQLPARSAADLEEVLEFCDDPEFIIDGTDRPTRRPQDSEQQREEYSGRKKRHTKKNIVLTEKARRLSENSSVLPAPLMDLLLEVLFDLDSDLGAHRSS